MAPNFLRSLSQRLKSKNRQSNQSAEPKQQEVIKLKDSQCQCRVHLLDQTELNLAIEKTAVGQEIYKYVFAYLDDLDERDYFGLQFTDHFQVHHWLDPSKRVRKQIPIGPPYTLRFRVKFFSNEPANLRDELTRYLFFLQLRHDIQNGRLECPKGTAIELAALQLQSEFGDFNPREHSQTFISEFRYHPMQDSQMELAVLQHWSAGNLLGMSPSQSELAFLEKARQLPLYGVDLHFVLGRDGQEYRIGLSPQGMLVLDGIQKIGLFLWEKIQRLDFRGRRLSLVVEEDLPSQNQKGGQLVQLHTFLFQLTSSRAAKHLWKCAIEFHTFFRLKFLRAPQQQRRVLPPLFRLGSTFKYRGRTEYETIHRREARISTVPVDHRRAESAERHVFRRPSRRYAPREPPIESRNGPGPTLIPVGDPANGREERRNEGNGRQTGSKIVVGKPMSTEL